jgi:hypothetical protein
MLEAIEGKIASAVAGSVSDRGPVYQTVIGHRPDSVPNDVIHPNASAVSGMQNAEVRRQRDHRVRLVAEERSRLGRKKVLSGLAPSGSFGRWG